MNDIPEAVFRSLIHISMGEEVIDGNTTLLFSFYALNEKLEELIEYIVKREVVSNLETPDMIFYSNSCYDLMIKSFCKREMNLFFDNISVLMIQKIHKSKYRFVNNAKSISKHLDDFVLLFELMIKELIRTDKYTSAMLYLFTQLQYKLVFSYPIENNTILESLLFQILCSRIERIPIKNSNDKAAVNTFLFMIQWFISPTEQEWSEEFKMKIVGIKSDINEWKQNLLSLFIDQESILIKWKISTSNLDKVLIPKIDEIRQYISKESQILLDIHFTDSYYLKKDFQKIVNELNRLRRNNFNEKSQALAQMSKIKLLTKDLKEEIRYLNEQLEVSEENAHHSIQTQQIEGLVSKSDCVN
ncbi:Ras-GAP domain-containing protein [Entamoeba marina]